MRTERFVLRPLSRTDTPTLFPSFADPDVMRWWSRGPFSSEAELADYLAPAGGWSEGRCWVVAQSKDGPALARLAAPDRGDDIVELGYLVCQGQQRKGVAREALTALVGYLFEVENRRRIYADTDPENIASIGLLESLGFTLEAACANNGPRTSAGATA